MFQEPPRYTWRNGNTCTLYGVYGNFTVRNARMGFATVKGIRISQRLLQPSVVKPNTYRTAMRAHSEYLTLSGLEQRKPTPWRVLEKEPTSHRKKWLKYKTSHERPHFLAFIRAVCPRVHIDDHFRILFKDQPKRNLDDTVHLHGLRALEAKVVGIGHPGWYLVSCALGVLTCHRSTLWCRGY